MKNHADHRSYQTIANGIRNLRDTLYWINEATSRHKKEFLSQPDLVNDPKIVGILQKLEDLHELAGHLKSDINFLRHDPAWHRNQLINDTSFHDLSQEERDRLKRMDANLNNVGDTVSAIASKIDIELAMRLNDQTDPMIDRNLAVGLSFHVKDDDPGAEEPADADMSMDDTLSTFELWPSELAARWPDGYACEFPMPHGGILHNLRLYGSCGVMNMDYRDILRAGTVWIDIKVEYQYCYDLAVGKWIKSHRADASGNLTYVSSQTKRA